MQTALFIWPRYFRKQNADIKWYDQNNGSLCDTFSNWPYLYGRIHGLAIWYFFNYVWAEIQQKSK